jgi:hypothetical protein
VLESNAADMAATIASLVDMGVPEITSAPAVAQARHGPDCPLAVLTNRFPDTGSSLISAVLGPNKHDVEATAAALRDMGMLEQPSVIMPPVAPLLAARPRQVTGNSWVSMAKQASRRQAPCRFFRSPAGCRNGTHCTFSHDTSPINYRQTRQQQRERSTACLSAAELARTPSTIALLAAISAQRNVRMLILVGPPGAGKSTLAKAICTGTGAQGGWVTVNQDSIGNRRLCESMVLHVLGGNTQGGGRNGSRCGNGGARGGKDWTHVKGTKVIIDRCNIGTVRCSCIACSDWCRHTSAHIVLYARCNVHPIPSAPTLDAWQ